MLQSILGKEGFVVMTAVNGREGMLLAKHEQPDLVIMDLMMPGLNGQQMLKEIRAMEQERGIFSGDSAKIIMTTALEDMENKISAFSSLCDGYLTKPIYKKQLLNELQKLKLIPQATENILDHF